MAQWHDEPVDSDPPGSFAGHLVQTLTGGALTMLISLGHRAALFEAAAAGPATSAGLADRAGLRERYVREWLGAMVTGGFFRYDPVTGDQRSPQDVLQQVRTALAPGGVFVMIDAKFSSHLAGNVGHPLAALCYATSLLYCIPVGLEGGGAGLGAMWGTELAGQKPAAQTGCVARLRVVICGDG